VLAYNGQYWSSSRLEEAAVPDSEPQEVRQLQERLDILDRRLDNIDSMVTAVAERVMRQPIVLNITCPRCGRDIEISLIGTHKPSR
jgi:tetrahydromethanopterin S-methyltransferase subunit G